MIGKRIRKSVGEIASSLVNQNFLQTFAEVLKKHTENYTNLVISCIIKILSYANKKVLSKSLAKNKQIYLIRIDLFNECLSYHSFS